MLSCGDGAASEISPGCPNSTFMRTQHFANYVELHIIGGASTVNMERRNEQYIDGAQRAVQSNGDSRKPTETERECATEVRLCKAMWPRETTAHSGDIGGGIGSPPAKTKSSGFAAEHRRSCRSETTRSLWLPARVVVVPAVSRCRTRMRCGTRTVRCWRAMWPRSDVQAATIASESVSSCRNKVLALCGRRLRGGGAKPARQRPSL